MLPFAFLLFSHFHRIIKTERKSHHDNMKMTQKLSFHHVSDFRMCLEVGVGSVKVGEGWKGE